MATFERPGNNVNAAPPDKPGGSGASESSTPKRSGRRKVAYRLEPQPKVNPETREVKLDPETQKPVVEEGSDLMAPIGKLRNALQLAVERGARTREQIEASIREQAKQQGLSDEKAEQAVTKALEVDLPALQEAFVYWTASAQVAEQVTIEQVAESLSKVKKGGKALREFVFELAKEYTDDGVLKGMAPGKIASLIIQDQDARNELIPIWNKLQTYDSEVASEDFYNTLSEFNKALSRSLYKQTSAETGDRETVAEDQIPNILTFQSKKDTEEDVRSVFKSVAAMRNRAISSGDSLQSATQQLLSDVAIENPETGEMINARELIVANAPAQDGAEQFIVLPKTDLIPHMQAARQYFDNLREENQFVVDRSNRRVTEDGERSYESLGTPISRLLYYLQLMEKKSKGEEIDESVIQKLKPDTMSSEIIEEELFHTLRTAIRAHGNKVSEDEIRNAASNLTQRMIDMDRLQSAYTQSKKDMRTKMSGAEQQWTPDPFSRQQRSFTEALLNEVNFSSTLDALNRGQHIELQFGGVYRDPEVDGLLRSENMDEDISTKRRHVEGFINSLRNYFTITEEMAQGLSEEECTELGLIAKAIYFYATEKRSNRLELANKRTQDTARLNENYAQVFRTLVNHRGLLEQLPGVDTPRPQDEDETEEAYQRRQRNFYRRKKRQRVNRQRKFLQERQPQIIADLQSIREALQSDKGLDNFLGTLGKIFNQSGAKLKQAIIEKIEDIRANPEAYQEEQYTEKAQERPPWEVEVDGKRMRPKPEKIQVFEGVKKDIDSIEIALNKAGADLNELFHRVDQAKRAEQDPQLQQELITAIEHWYNEYHRTADAAFKKLHSNKNFTSIRDTDSEKVKMAAHEMMTKYQGLVNQNRKIRELYKKVSEEFLPKEYQRRLDIEKLGKTKPAPTESTTDSENIDAQTVERMAAEIDTLRKQLSVTREQLRASENGTEAAEVIDKLSAENAKLLTANESVAKTMPTISQLFHVVAERIVQTDPELSASCERVATELDELQMQQFDTD